MSYSHWLFTKSRNCVCAVNVTITLTSPGSKLVRLLKFFFFRVMENNLFVFRMQLWRKVTRFCGGMGDVVEKEGREREKESVLLAGHGSAFDLKKYVYFCRCLRFSVREVEGAIHSSLSYHATALVFILRNFQVFPHFKKKMWACTLAINCS